MLSLFTKKYLLDDVFTPTKAADLTYVPRTPLDTELDRALHMPGMQIVLYGHSGGGKTTLITNELKKLELNHITTSCVSSTKVSDIMLVAFDKLNAFYTSERTESKGRSLSASISAQYENIVSIIQAQSNNSKAATQSRIVPVQLTPQRLAEFLGAANCLWIIEDFHKVSAEEKTNLSQLLKVFMDASSEYRNVRIVCIGAVGTAREIVAYDAEMQNRVSEIHVPLLREEDLSQILEKGMKCLNISFTNDLKKKIIHYSNRLAAVCHQLCFDICFSQRVMRTCTRKRIFDMKYLEKAVKAYVKQNSDTFSKVLDKALKQRKGKYQNARLILEALLDMKDDQVSFSQILSKIRERKRSYPSSNLSLYLKPLTTAENSEILRYDHNADRYSFSSPFFKAFVLMRFDSEKGKLKKEALRVFSNDDFLMAYSEYIAKVTAIQKEYIKRRGKILGETKK